MNIPKDYPGPDKVKAILVEAKINGKISERSWIDYYAQQPEEYHKQHYWLLWVKLGEHRELVWIGG